MNSHPEYYLEFVWHANKQCYTSGMFPGLQVWPIAKDLVRVTWDGWEHDEQVWTGLELAGWIAGTVDRAGGMTR